MIAKTPQEVLDALGYVVLAYSDTEELATDLACGYVSGETINSAIPDDAVVKIIGVATAEDWAEQCRLTSEPFRTALETPHIGYLKATAE